MCGLIHALLPSALLPDGGVANGTAAARWTHTAAPAAPVKET